MTHAALAAFFLLTTGCGPSEAADEPSLRLVDNRAVEVTGLSSRTLDALVALTEAERAGVLSVRTLDADDDPQAPAMLGRRVVDGNRLVFEPRFPFAPGVGFVARYTPTAGERAAELEFRLEASEAAGETRVVTVYPSAETWPMNQLKMYVHFSAPMRTGSAFDHIRLIDRSDGSEVEQPFVTVQEELWDRERTVLTVLYDPARIKRGLAPHLEAGLPLRAGGSYRLVIDAAWRDAGGRLLAASFTRDFRITAPDRASPNPARWRIALPEAGTREALTIAFDEPIDHGLLHSLIGIRRSPAAPATGDDDWRISSDTVPADEIRGTVEVTANETILRFRPEEPWDPGVYEIVVPTILEDLAGNTLGGLFDAEVGAAPTPFAAAEAAYRVFEVVAPALPRG